MTKSVNQSWAVSQKFRNRYGSTWADLDFFFKDRIYSNTFKSDPMNTNVGALQIEGMSLPFKYKDLIMYNKKATKLGAQTHRSDIAEKFAVDIKSKTFMLNRQEINRLRETLDDALTTVQRSYELGLYL